MSKLRPECGTVRDRPAMDDTVVMFFLREAVAKRRSLIYGKLHDAEGNHCAMGCLWTDYPGAVVNTSLVDEIAAVNDAIPATASNHERWKKVNKWLKFKLEVMKGQHKKKTSK